MVFKCSRCNESKPFRQIHHRSPSGLQMGRHRQEGWARSGRWILAVSSSRFAVVVDPSAAQMFDCFAWAYISPICLLAFQRFWFGLGQVLGLGASKPSEGRWPEKERIQRVSPAWKGKDKTFAARRSDIRQRAACLQFVFVWREFAVAWVVVVIFWSVADLSIAFVFVRQRVCWVLVMCRNLIYLQRWQVVPRSFCCLRVFVWGWVARRTAEARTWRSVVGWVQR